MSVPRKITIVADALMADALSVYQAFPPDLCIRLACDDDEPATFIVRARGLRHDEYATNRVAVDLERVL